MHQTLVVGLQSCTKDITLGRAAVRRTVLLPSVAQSNASLATSASFAARDLFSSKLLHCSGPVFDMICPNNLSAFKLVNVDRHDVKATTFPINTAKWSSWCCRCTTADCYDILIHVHCLNGPFHVWHELGHATYLLEESVAVLVLTRIVADAFPVFGRNLQKSTCEVFGSRITQKILEDLYCFSVAREGRGCKGGRRN